MNKDQKRYRQINIKESFALCKKTKTNAPVPDMEQNLRDLMAAAAESRASTLKSAVIPDKKVIPNKNRIPTPSINHGASTSKEQPMQSELLEVPDSEESCMPCSIELFPDSTELLLDSTELLPGSTELLPDSTEFLSDSPLVEQCSSQETEDINIVDSSSYSQNSPEVFSQNEEVEIDSPLEEDDSEEEVQIAYLNRKPKCGIPLPKLEPLENHAIMFSTHIRPGEAPRPYPATYKDKWDFDHVRMPCSNLNKYPVENIYGVKEIRSRWDLICRSLRRPMSSAKDLENAIMQYNSQYRAKWNFNNLHTFINTILSDEGRSHFFQTILPNMVIYALELPNICTQPVPLLKKDCDYYVTMSQKQIGCLLLNAFFCTFPRRNVVRNGVQKWNHEYGNYPDINFNRLFYGVKNKTSTSTEKLKCLVSYFNRITTREPKGTVTFHRQCLNELPIWKTSTKSVRAVVVKSDGLIEKEGHGMLQVDFANKFIGGGVLGYGCVQEEIRFIICPELIVSRLFVECLGPTEVLIVTGVEQYCDYSGYSNTFKFEDKHYDKTPQDAWGRKYTEIVAMDATHFTNVADQFKLSCILRELNKAYCGFYEDGLPSDLSAVASGNWGCGAFNGNPSLKFIIQLMAASQAGRDLLYFTFGNKALKKELKNIANFLVENNLVVGDLCRILIHYCKSVLVSRKGLSPTLYNFLCSIFSSEDNIEDASPNEPSQNITDSDKNAIEKLLEAVENSNTEIEDNDGATSDHG